MGMPMVAQIMIADQMLNARRHEIATKTDWH